MLSIMLTLISFHTSQKAYSEEAEKIKNHVFLDSPIEEENAFGAVTQRLNILSLIAFVVGVGFLSTFAVLNI